MHRPFVTSPAPHSAAPASLRSFLTAGALTALASFALFSTPAFAAEPKVNSPAQTSTATPAKPDDKGEAQFTPMGSWRLEDIKGGGVIDGAPAQLDLTADGQSTGSGGCNRFMGQATLSGKQLRFGPQGSTRMACSEAAMNQEFRFLKALEEVQSWSIDGATQKLHLQDKDGNTLLVFSAV